MRRKSSRGRGGRSCQPGCGFLPNELATLEEVWQKSKFIPSEKILRALVEQFSKFRNQNGKVVMKMSKVNRWFQNRKKQEENQIVLQQEDFRNRVNATSDVTLSGITEMEFEAKSSKDGAWYDVHAVMDHRKLKSGDPEVRVRFVGYGASEDEWVNVKAAIRQRSVPCESAECISILPGETVLCFQEENESARYYDACVVNVERKKHDVRGCRCKFMVQYEHNRSMGILPLMNICRRPGAS